MAKDVADIAWGFTISRYTARAFDCAWTGIVGCDSEVNHAKPVEHLPQISRRAEDIGHGVKAIGDAEFLAVAGISWPRPAAPAGLTARGL